LRNVPESDVTSFETYLVENDEVRKIETYVQQLMECEDEECCTEILETYADFEPSKCFVHYVPRGKVFEGVDEGRRILVVLIRRDTELKNVLSSLGISQP